MVVPLDPTNHHYVGKGHVMSEEYQVWLWLAEGECGHKWIAIPFDLKWDTCPVCGDVDPASVDEFVPVQLELRERIGELIHDSRFAAERNKAYFEEQQREWDAIPDAQKLKWLRGES